jgi:hypothetical protein
MFNLFKKKEKPKRESLEKYVDRVADALAQQGLEMSMETDGTGIDRWGMQDERKYTSKENGTACSVTLSVGTMQESDSYYFGLNTNFEGHTHIERMLQEMTLDSVFGFNERYNNHRVGENGGNYHDAYLQSSPRLAHCYRPLPNSAALAQQIFNTVQQYASMRTQTQDLIDNLTAVDEQKKQILEEFKERQALMQKQ